MIGERTERLLDLFADMPAVRITLGPPRFAMPDEVGEALGLPSCSACGHAIHPPSHGLVRWQGDDLHTTCAHDELLALATAA